MDAKFYGGPYDGLSLDHNQISRYSMDVLVRTQRLQFLVMPPLPQWEEVVSGARSKANLAYIYVYQRHFLKTGLEYHDVTASDALNHAMEDGRRRFEA